MIYSIVIVLITLLLLYAKTKNLALILKILASLTFVYTAIFSYLKNPINSAYPILLFIGLIFALFGDIFLVLKSRTKEGLDNVFLMGLISFSITHIFYSSAFMTLGSFGFVTLISTILFSIFYSVFFDSLKCINFKNMFYPSHIYIIAVSFMFSNTLGLIGSNINHSALLLMLIGALLFMISDFILTFVLFFDNCPKFMELINLLTYYLGQILLALSILYLSK